MIKTGIYEDDIEDVWTIRGTDKEREDLQVTKFLTMVNKQWVNKELILS